MILDHHPLETQIEMIVEIYFVEMRVEMVVNFNFRDVSRDDSRYLVVEMPL